MLNIDDLIVDKEFDELLPVLTLEEFERLEQSILKNGMLDPIKVWEEPGTGRYIIIDGHNRYKILKKHNISLKYWEDYKIMYADELPDRDAVKQWMLEQQLGRRNLSEAERYEIVQKFKSVFEKKAKDNQSSGGKGLSNLSKVNTRKEMAKAVGVSEGTYQKMDKIMQSDNEDLKHQLREKKVSVDRAYREIKNPTPAKKEEVTPQQQIEKVDNRMNEIDKEISSLKTEREALMRRRSSLFEVLDIECPVKFRFNVQNSHAFAWKCQIYIEYANKEHILFEGNCYYDENPADIYLKKIPEKYQSDFRMVWKQAHDEVVRLQEEEEEKEKEDLKKAMEAAKEQDELFKKMRNLIPNEEDKIILKKFYHVLANTFHPDNEKTGDADMMQYVNNLKEMWGI